MVRSLRQLIWLSCAAVPGLAAADTAGYPTLERVMFVDACAKHNTERPRQEMIYKCVCVLDQLASEFSYEEFSTLQTASLALTMTGERGRIMRSEDMRTQANRFRSALETAQAACLLSP
jgi:hypothetical protein